MNPEFTTDDSLSIRESRLIKMFKKNVIGLKNGVKWSIGCCFTLQEIIGWAIYWWFGLVYGV